MNKKQSGFSLIELVVVIVVVGLLAVAALPRFLNVTDEAKKASIEGVAGGFATAVLSARAQWEAEMRPTKMAGANQENYVNYDGTEFWLTRSTDEKGNNSGFRDGYPLDIITENGNFSSQVSNASCIRLMENLLQNPPKVDTVENAENNRNIKYSAQVVNGDSCVYTQQEGSVKHQFEYEVKTGRVTVNLQ